MNKVLFATAILIAVLILLAFTSNANKPPVTSADPSQPTAYESLNLSDDDFTEVKLSDEQWRSKLNRMQFYVTREHGTERAFTGAYDANKKKGLYRCVCCGLPLFKSETKFDSGTGWPSFYAPIAETNIETETDLSGFSARTEVHCVRCKGHLGHVFNDGPKITGLRYCMNSASLHFIETEE